MTRTFQLSGLSTKPILNLLDSISTKLNGRVLARCRFREYYPDLTEPKDKCGETRCYIRDPDGYIIEVGQSKPGLV